MIVIAVLAGLIIGYGIFEYSSHQRRVGRFPIRIHVNGSRGKSSVTRLIAAGLRAGGIRTYGKTTGTSPRVIDPQGLEIPIHRLRGASIGEQVKMFRYFDRKQPKALVVECMAIQPNYQWLSEHQMIHSTIGVITNVRPDHTKEMGPGLVQIAKSLSNSIPFNGKAFTSETDLLPVMQDIAGQRGTELVSVPADAVSAEEMERFTYVEHPENVSLALAVCGACGVDRDVAIAGMFKAHPDPGAMRLVNIQVDGKQITFVNGFAANDPDSTLRIWRQIEDLRQGTDQSIILLNSRIDRFPRTLQLVDMVTEHIQPDVLVLVGGRTAKAKRRAQHEGMAAGQVIDLGEASPERVFQACLKQSTSRALIFGIGNMGGGGGEIVEYFKYHTTPGEEMYL